MLEKVVIISLICLIIAVLLPLLTHYRVPDGSASPCVAGMNQIGKAMKMYASDWGDQFPINEFKHPGEVRMSAVVPLSDQGVDKKGERIRFQHGVNWVEALHPYVEKVSEGYAESVWCCNAINERRTGSRKLSVSYAMNANLAGKPEGIIRNAGSLMLIRELSGLYDSVLRPDNVSTLETTPPRDAFLNATESGKPVRNYKLHGDGSYILFTDGHVKWFDVRYLPEKCQWDPVAKQWFNYVNLPQTDPMNRSIAVSP